MLPESQHRPTGIEQPRIRVGVSEAIRLNLLPPELGVNPVGMTILLAFSVSFGFILPINAPQNMVCMGTDTFTPRQFTRVGLYLTVIGYLLLLLFAATWWKILGLM